MNEYNDADAFNGIINHGFDTNPQASPPTQYTDPTPYGPAPHHGAPVKTGLTPRGKAVMVAFAAPLLLGGLLGWQHYASTQAANDLKAQELSLQQQQLEVEKLKALGEANQAQQKTQTAAYQARQKLIDSCVEDNKGLVGKQLGATYRSVLEDCQMQYPDTAATGADMQEAASASTSSSGGSGVNDFVLIGGGALALGVAFAVKRGARRPEPAPVIYRPY